MVMFVLTGSYANGGARPTTPVTLVIWPSLMLAHCGRQASTMVHSYARASRVCAGVPRAARAAFCRTGVLFRPPLQHPAIAPSWDHMPWRAETWP
mmetsp:Transcript_9662/g.33983  ORF Transcript_9662/g.33983 Transcript_9662/m.33983 type:complete len:95 (+) Transcript_9662:867-1151(+)